MIRRPPAPLAATLGLVLTLLGSSDVLAQSASDTSLVQIGSSDGQATAFVAWAAGGRRAPAVIMVHDWWGFNAQIRRVARNLARQGYVVIVPDIYRGTRASNLEMARRMAQEIDRQRAVADIEASIAWLRQNERTRDAHIAIMGYNLGGRMAQHMAMHSDQLSSAVMFHARPLVDESSLRALRVPLLAHFAAQDEYVDVALAEQLREGMQAADKPGRVFVYQGAHHGFTYEAEDDYHPDATRLAWARTLAFLQRTLKASK